MARSFRAGVGAFYSGARASGRAMADAMRGAGADVGNLARRRRRGAWSTPTARRSRASAPARSAPIAPAERGAAARRPRALARRRRGRGGRRAWCAAAHAEVAGGLRGGRGWSASTARRSRTIRAGAARTRSGDGDLAGAATAACRWSGTSAAADVASGGEGAPLVPFFHFACARRIGADRAARLPQPRRRRQRHLGRSARGAARGDGRARRLRHRAGQCADRRLPAGAAGARTSTPTARSRRRGAVDEARAGRSRRHPYLRPDAAQVARPATTSTAFSTGSRISRPRTARRR